MTVALIVVNVVAWLFELTMGMEGIGQFFLDFGVTPRRFTDPQWAVEQGLDPGNYLPFLTSLFLHGGWMHLIFNMWVLWIFGDNVEDRMGPIRYLLFYIVCGVASSSAQLVAHPTAEIPMVGASGAIAGVMGAYFFMFPRSRVLTVIPIIFWPLFIEIPAVVFLGLWFLFQFLSGAIERIGPVPVGGIAWWAHVGGFIAGMVLHRMFLIRRRG